MSSNDKSSREGLRNLSTDSGDIADYYDEWAEDYDQTLAQWRYQAPERAAALLRAALEPDAVILDAGCGTGLTGRALAGAGFSTFDGIDVSQRSLDVAARLGIYRSLLRVDMQKLPLPFDDDSYEGLMCVGVMTYLPDSSGTLGEFRRLVKPGGAVLLTQRTDIHEERDFPAVLRELKNQDLIRDVTISEPGPYLPANEEFGDEVMVHYIGFRVAGAGR
ncbi:MAG: class I SAM-dependent methyltransferase [Gammaproteobacteria bacterium]|nr:class I SAM-dependent methyltransferase [Gammaproteobacteria bacterium]